eukprot:TRINITY_DN569_c0_g2_i1.p1 TRINITY_DN569_c0_g2~~TRINITY_DN569_c0_g2_i1.p1  ORF type:complete len:520 (-),score=102.11 TRINITY_DN569_c0_g2_i1:26-1585(-)
MVRGFLASESRALPMAVRARRRRVYIVGSICALSVACAPVAWIHANQGKAWRPTLWDGLKATGDERVRPGSSAEPESRFSSALVSQTCLFGLAAAGFLVRRFAQTRSACACQVLPVQQTEARTELEPSRGELVRVSGLAAAASLVPAPARAEQVPDGEAWVQYDLNTGEVLYDIDFDPLDKNHGFVVGARGLFYETKDGGKRWVSRSFANLGKSEDVTYRFQNVAVLGDDVWILGKPPLLLHSKDAGKSWKKVPLSKKLPGEPKVVTALGKGKAEMATSSGAVYVTENDGKNWKSLVQETVDATLNRVSSSGTSGASYFTGSVKSIKRAADGRYLAVAQRGNFYLSFSPGEPRWLPHSRISARRIQAMGFRQPADGTKEPGAWMSLNGGYLTQSDKEGYDELSADSKEFFKYAEIRSGGIGIIDIAYRTPLEAWAAGGSGVIYQTKDGGKTWQFDPSGTDLPCNLYNVKFFEGGKVGYMIGSAGVLLRRSFDNADAGAAAGASAAADPSAGTSASTKSA